MTLKPLTEFLAITKNWIKKKRKKSVIDNAPVDDSTKQKLRALLKEAYRKAYNTGWQKGHAEGFKKGQENGKKSGYNKARSDQKFWANRNRKGWNNKTTKFKARILRRDHFTCHYCGLVDGDLTIDHMIPISRGGQNQLTNLVACCFPCNIAKGSMTHTEFMYKS